MSDDKPFHNPFGALSAFRARLPQTPDPPAPKPPVPPHVSSSGAPTRTIPRAVVRMERSGRGGKEVTIIEHLGLRPDERDIWLKALKAGLGCGGVVEGDALVLQGDHRDRVPRLLTARGVKKVTVG
jgi:translation initiation factor 1